MGVVRLFRSFRLKVTVKFCDWNPAYSKATIVVSLAQFPMWWQKAYVNAELSLLGGGCAVCFHHLALMCHLFDTTMIHLFESQQQ